MTASFDEFFSNDVAPATTDNFLAREPFSAFAPEQTYVIEVTKFGTSDTSKKGFMQLQLSVDAVSASGVKESMGSIWVPTPEPIVGSDAEKALKSDPTTPEYKDAVKLRNMFGRMLFDFLKAAVPDKFYLYKLDKVGKKTIAVTVPGGEELAQEDREAIDAKMSAAVSAFSKAAINGAAGEMLVGKRFGYRTVPNKKNPQYTNPVYLTPDLINS